jgi:hypothetical protein
VSVGFPPISGSDFKLTIDAVHQVRSLDYYSTFTGTTDIMPVGIAELGIAGVAQPEPPVQIPAVCQAGLLSIDGSPVDVQITGMTHDALAGQPVSVEPCGNSATGVHLSAGPHVIATSPRLPSGWSIDSLVMASAPTAVTARETSVRAAPPAPPTVTVGHHDRTSWDLTVRSTGRPFWLVLGQSFSSGWSATIGGHPLGKPRLIDGYATGWLVPEGAVSGTAAVHIEWKPQRVVWAAIAASAAALLACLALAVWPSRRRRARAGESGASENRADRHPGFRETMFRRDRTTPGTRPSPKATIVASVTWGLLVAIASRPAIGAVALLATAAACSFLRGRFGVRTLCAAAMLSIPVYVVQQQASHNYLPTIDWPAALSSANDIAWFALAMLGADVVAGAARAYWRRSAAPTLTREDNR